MSKFPGETIVAELDRLTAARLATSIISRLAAEPGEIRLTVVVGEGDPGEFEDEPILGLRPMMRVEVGGDSDGRIRPLMSISALISRRIRG